jgi:hypothetical protein
MRIDEQRFWDDWNAPDRQKHLSIVPMVGNSEPLVDPPEMAGGPQPLRRARL